MGAGHFSSLYHAAIEEEFVEQIHLHTEIVLSLKMPAKLIESFAGEKPDLEKQIGCVAGIFQMLDRHIFLARQRPNRGKHKKFPPVVDHGLRERSRHESESSPYWYENEKASMESSRASCSSVSSSSLSSLEFDKSFFSERTLRNSSSFRSWEVDCKFDSGISGPSAKSCRRSSDHLLNTLREAEEVLNVRTCPIDKVKNQNHAYKHQDSPRPSWHTATDNKPTNLEEAIGLLIEFKKAPWSFGRELTKSCASRQASQWSSTFEDSDKANKSPCINRAANLLLQNLSSRSSQKRHPGVVAKLMGIEDMPESNSPAKVAVVRRTMREKNDLVSKLPEDHHHSLLKQMPIKDLEAFKRMVDAIRAQRMAKNNTILLPEGNNQHVRSPKVRKQPTKAESFEPPIVIMKPAKTINSVMQLEEGLSTDLPKLHTSTRRKGCAGITDVTTVDQSSRKCNSPRCQSNSTQLLQGENLGTSPRTSSARSPRSPTSRKIEAEKKPPCSPTSKKPLESVSPRGRLRPKPSQERKNRDQVDEIVSERRIANCRDDETSSDSNRSNQKHRHASERELASIAPTEQPSPSPQKKSSYTVQEKLAQLEEMSSNEHEENPDNKYISDILLAAGFLNKESAIPSQQQHINPDIFRVLEKQHGHQKLEVERIHRKLVFDAVREILAHKRSKNSGSSLLRGRRTLSGRQLLGEICSEIKELEEAGSRRSSTFEDGVELVSREDILGRSEGWKDFGMEKIRVAMQIERLLLQDLINETVDEAGLQTKRTKMCS